jgi:type II secretory pathway component PulK
VKRTRRQPADERGVALILCLLVLSILIILITQFGFSVKVDEKISRNSKDDVKAIFAARGALAYVRAVLREDRKKSKVDSLREDWAGEALQAVRIGDTDVTLKVEDCERRLDLNLLGDPATRPFARNTIAHLCEKLGIDEPAPAEIADRIADYVDPDTDGDYEAGAKNAPLDAPEELFAIKEIPEDVLVGRPAQGEQPERKGLLQFFTVWGAKKININTMPLELAYAILPDKVGQTSLDASARDDAVQKIDAFRTGGDSSSSSNPGTGANGQEEKPGKDFESVQQLGQVVPQIAPALAPRNGGPGPGNNNNNNNNNGGGGAPGPSDAAAKPPASLGEMLTVSAQDYRIEITVAAGVPQAGVGYASASDAAAAAANALERRYEAILRRGKDHFDVLFWREVPR